MNFVKNQNYIIKSICSTESLLNPVSERLIDLGLRSELTIKVVEVLYSGKIIIIQFEKTILALNEMEVSCLQF